VVVCGTALLYKGDECGQLKTNHLRDNRSGTPISFKQTGKRILDALKDMLDEFSVIYQKRLIV
jgi:hypothetical protein